MVLPVLHYLKLTPEGETLLAPRANIARWQAAIDERESAVATVPSSSGSGVRGRCVLRVRWRNAARRTERRHTRLGPPRYMES